MLAHIEYRDALLFDGEAQYEAARSAHEATATCVILGRNAFGPGSDDWTFVAVVVGLEAAVRRQHEEALAEEGFDFTQVVDSTGKVVL